MKKLTAIIKDENVEEIKLVLKNLGITGHWDSQEDKRKIIDADAEIEVIERYIQLPNPELGIQSWTPTEIRLEIERLSSGKFDERTFGSAMRKIGFEKQCKRNEIGVPKQMYQFSWSDRMLRWFEAQENGLVKYGVVASECRNGPDEFNRLVEEAKVEIERKCDERGIYGIDFENLHKDQIDEYFRS